MDEDRPADLLRMTVEARAGWTVVHLAGDLDYTTVERVRECREQLLAAGRCRIALELSALEFCDSVGFAFFAETWNRTHQADGRMALVRPAGHVARMMTVMGMDRFVADIDDLSGQRPDNGGASLPAAR